MFFDRYNALCRMHNPPIDPCGRQIAKIIGINNSTATTWKQNGTTPKGETIRAIADFFGVSADYLLDRTDDQTDYAHKPNTLTEEESQMLDMFRHLDRAGVEDCFKYLDFALHRQAEDRKKASETA